MDVLQIANKTETAVFPKDTVVRLSIQLIQLHLNFKYQITVQLINAGKLII